MQQARIECPAGAPPRPAPAGASSRIGLRLVPPAAAAVRARPCLECGEAFLSPRLEAEFCSTACRKDWNNRRAVRGAQLYDLFMALRFERGPAKLAQVWTLLCAVASAYRDADKAKRGGRRSWRRLRAAIADIPMAYGSHGDGR